MFTSMLRPGLAAMLLVLAGIFPARAQTNAPPTNAPAATPPPVAPIAMAEVVTQAQAAIAQLKGFDEQTSPDLKAQEVRAALDDLKAKIDERWAADQRFAEASPSLGNLQISQAAWQSIDQALTNAQIDLSNRVSTQTELLTTLNALDAKWKATLTSAQRPVAGNISSPAVIQSIEEVQSHIAATRKGVQAGLNDLYTLQKQVAGQADRVKTGLDEVAKSIATAQAALFRQTHPRLYDPEAFATQGAGMVRHETQSLQEQVAGVRTYLGARTGALLIHALLLALLIAAFYWLRNVVREQAKTEANLRDAERIFNAPLATALLLALVASNWLYPPDEAPRLLWSAIGALALVPTVIVVRRLISVELLPLLDATVAAFLIDQVRFAATPAGVFARMAFLVELLAVCIFILAALRSKHLCVSSANPGQMEKVVRAYLHVAYFVFLAGVLANVLGYVPLSFLIGNGMLKCSYVAIVFYAAVRILDALALAALSVRPIRTFGMVRKHHDLVYSKVAKILRWGATAAWVVVALEGFYLWDPLWQWSSDELTAKHSWGAIQNIQLGPILAFPITVWVAFALSRFVRFALEEDVYPNLNLPRGIPYAISTMVHYAILVIGFFMALSAIGIDLSNYAVLAGAFGVGLGFGLQNIMNNFISGLILLFERPVKVGDTVQIDANTVGRVERIGIRASVILLTNGSELILPNGNLISNPVTNWTLSICERLVEVPVNVAAKADIARALDVLSEVAKHHSAVLKNPSPQAVIITIAAASTSLKLRCWLDSEEDWMKVTSELYLALVAALEKENIALA